MSTRPVWLSALVWSLALTLWGGGLYGVLQITHVPGEWGHWLCGPWGCGPRLQALIACHAFWLVLLFPAAAVAKWHLPRPQVRLAGGVLAALGVLAVLAIAGTQAVTWLQVTKLPQFFVQRVLFCLATTVDVPAVEVLLVGLYLRFGGKSGQETPPETTEEAAGLA